MRKETSMKRLLGAAALAVAAACVGTAPAHAGIFDRWRSSWHQPAVVDDCGCCGAPVVVNDCGCCGAPAEGTPEVGKKAEPLHEPSPGGVTFKPFTSAEGRFSVEFPGDPKTDKQGDVSLAKVETPNKVVFAVAFSDVPADKDAPTAVDALKAYIEGRKGKLSGEPKKFTFKTADDEFPGREAEFELPDGTVVRVRLFFVKKRQYVLAVEGPPAAVRNADADKFLDSFKLKE
jgi:hypothetical protein